MTLFDSEGPPLCWKCKGARRVWSQRVGDYIPCPECAANEAIQQTDDASDANPVWRELAETAFYHLALTRADFTMDDVHAYFDRTNPGVMTHMDRDERRRWGAVARYAMKEGWVERTDTYRRSERRHSTPLVVWRSLIHRQESLWSE